MLAHPSPRAGTMVYHAIRHTFSNGAYPIPRPVVSYIAGLAIIGIPGVIVPRETSERKADTESAAVEANDSTL